MKAKELTVKTLRLIAIASLFLGNYTYAGVLDFEDAGAFGGDDAVISADYLASQGFSMSAVSGNTEETASSIDLTFEAAGKDGTDAFETLNQGIWDTPAAGDLGNYFLKAGNGYQTQKHHKYFKMDIQYAPGTTEIGGEIWDVHSHRRYKVTAFDASGSKISKITSPSNFDGRPWEFSLATDPTTGQTIDRVEIEYIGTPSLSGFAMNNMYSTTNATPIPAAFPLALTGVAAVIARKRRAQKNLAGETEGDGVPTT